MRLSHNTCNTELLVDPLLFLLEHYLKTVRRQPYQKMVDGRWHITSSRFIKLFQEGLYFTHVTQHHQYAGNHCSLETHNFKTFFKNGSTSTKNCMFPCRNKALDCNWMSGEGAKPGLSSFTDHSACILQTYIK